MPRKASPTQRQTQNAALADISRMPWPPRTAHVRVGVLLRGRPGKSCARQRSGGHRGPMRTGDGAMLGLPDTALQSPGKLGAALVPQSDFSRAPYELLP